MRHVTALRKRERERERCKMTIVLFLQVAANTDLMMIFEKFRHKQVVRLFEKRIFEMEFTNFNMPS